MTENQVIGSRSENPEKNMEMEMEKEKEAIVKNRLSVTEITKESHDDYVGGKGEGGSEGVQFDAAAEKKLLRKCDLNVIPCITLLFFLAFLDRTNIGM